MDAKRVLILGVGNLLLADEGVGVHALRALRACALPAGVELVDAGTNALDFLDEMLAAERIVIVDALRADGSPGTIYRVSPDELSADPDRPLSVHQVGVLEALGMARQLGARAEVTIIGVEPETIDWGMELSPAIAARLAQVLDALRAEVAR
ncbi:MAG: HyaD/HybD family hydrogenase maturation endopeptidase [Deltaproteobacteria bacterium]|nr:HyaD/HybD family hydrogenase maturation endopeptidase [Deltaproteobacteria bacterium]